MWPIVVIDGTSHAHTRPTPQKWVKTFPPDFYKEMFGLTNIPYAGTLKAPRYIGHLTNDVVYAHLAPSVLGELQKQNPQTESGRRATKLHRRLSRDIGHPKLLSTSRPGRH
jgi:hypothetical protein